MNSVVSIVYTNENSFSSVVIMLLYSLPLPLPWFWCIYCTPYSALEFTEPFSCFCLPRGPLCALCDLYVPSLSFQRSLPAEKLAEPPSHLHNSSDALRASRIWFLVWRGKKHKRRNQVVFVRVPCHSEALWPWKGCFPSWIVVPMTVKSSDQMRSKMQHEWHSCAIPFL